MLPGNGEAPSPIRIELQTCSHGMLLRFWLMDTPLPHRTAAAHGRFVLWARPPSSWSTRRTSISSVPPRQHRYGGVDACDRLIEATLWPERMGDFTKFTRFLTPINTQWHVSDEKQKLATTSLSARLTRAVCRGPRCAQRKPRRLPVVGASTQRGGGLDPTNMRRARRRAIACKPEKNVNQPGLRFPPSR